MEPERKIEKWLRAYAKKRRAAAGEPSKMHPAMRRILQSEVARLGRPEEKPSLSLWQLVRQEWAWLAGFALVIFFTATLFLPALSSAKHKVQHVTAMTRLRLIDTGLQLAAENNNGKLPASLNDLTNELGKIPSDPRDGKPFVYVAGGATLDDLQTNSVLAYSPDDQGGRAVLFADGRIDMETPAEFSDKAKDLPTQLALRSREIQNAKTPEVTTMAKNESDLSEPMTTLPPNPEEPAPGESQLMASTTGVTTNTQGTHFFGGFGGVGGFGGIPHPAASPPRVPLAIAANQALPPQGQFYRNIAQQNASPPNSKADLLMQSIVVQPQAVVLVNFQLQQNGNALRVVDSDGSIYVGSILPTNTLAQNIPSQAENGEDTLKPSQSTDQSIGQSTAGTLSFRVTGLNRTSQQNVIFDGNLAAVSTANGINNTTFQPRQQTARQQQSLPPGYHVTGNATVGGTNQINIDAVPVPQ
ncbi:MAG TPA: hypothetical protein VGI03_02220 [Verrucomicrobiae bacterium]|jgi:hypothetical protein